MILTKKLEQKVVQAHKIQWIYSMFHNNLTSVHYDFQTTYRKIKSRYFWLTIYKDIKEFV